MYVFNLLISNEIFLSFFFIGGWGPHNIFIIGTVVCSVDLCAQASFKSGIPCFSAKHAD